MSEIYIPGEEKIKKVRRTFIHDLVENSPINKDRISFIDLTESEIASPSFGFSVGENQYMIGAGRRNADARFLVTDKLLHCTGIVIEAEDQERFLLAHVMSTDFVSDMFRNFRDSLGNPERVKSVTMVPGFDHYNQVDARIKAILTQSDKLNPDSLVVDIASGKAGEFRGIVVDTIGGGVYGLHQPVPIETSQRFSQEWNRSVLK